MDPRLKISFNEEEHELFMSYGLLTRLVSAVGMTADSMTQGFAVDGDTRDLVLMECLAKRGKNGVVEIKEEFSFDDYPDFTPEVAEKIFDWAIAHVTDFFMRRLKAGQASLKPLMDQLQDLMPSQDGLETSPSQTASVGDLESTQATSQNSSGQ